MDDDRQLNRNLPESSWDVDDPYEVGCPCSMLSWAVVLFFVVLIAAAMLARAGGG